MKKKLKLYLNIILTTAFFIPALIGTFCIVVLYGPTIPMPLFIVLILLWIGSALLRSNRVVGSLCGSLSPVLLMIIMHDEYMHVNIIPYTSTFIIYYIICGIIVCKKNRQHT